MVVEAEAGREPNPFTVEWAGLMLKARSAVEDSVPYLYIEPSNENVDFENQRVDQDGLRKAATYFQAHGVVDIGHFSMAGMAEIAKSLGFDPVYSRIGFPVGVRTQPTIMVKAQLLTGDGPEAQYAHFVRRTLDQGMPWYPSIGGRPGPMVCEQGVCTLYHPLWSNIGLWNEPINPSVKAVSLLPFGTFAKALVSGYGTDAAQFTQGRALQQECLEGDEDRHYRRHAHAYLHKLLTGHNGCEHLAVPPTAELAEHHFAKCDSVGPELAARMAKRLIDEWTTATAIPAAA